ncbi:MAG: shikimate kinase [Nitriliruptoraceae bacterium]
MSRSIHLTGMMGSGKSTVAEVLGRRLGRSVVDTDREVERWTGRSVADIFTSEGEARFRDLERQVVTEVSREPDLVVALGGGAVLADDAVADLLLTGVIIHLDVPVDVLAERLAHQWHARPLRAARAAAVAADEPARAAALQEVLGELLARRGARYREVADLSVDGARDPEDVAQDVLEGALGAGDVLTPSEHEQVMT